MRPHTVEKASTHPIPKPSLQTVSQPTGDAANPIFRCFLREFLIAKR